MKLHPSLRNNEECKKYIKKYKYVFLIEDDSYCAEEIVINTYIDSVLSDFSSVLINIPSIDESIKCYTYKNFLNKYVGKECFPKVSLFEKMLKNEKITIKNF